MVEEEQMFSGGALAQEANSSSLSLGCENLLPNFSVFSSRPNSQVDNMR